MEMRVVGGKAGELPAASHQVVEQRHAIRPGRQHLAGVVVDLDRMRRVERQPVGEIEPIPLRVGNADKGAGGSGATRQCRPVLALRRRGEVMRQADREDVPEIAQMRCRCMQLGAD